MYVLKAQQMRNADAMASNEFGLPGIVLMENAARAVYEYIIEKGYKSIIIVCGGGNNGGDGFALARLLRINGCKIRVFCFADRDRINGDALVNLNILDKMGVNISSSMDELKHAIHHCNAVVDAIFGTGFHGEIHGSYEEAIKLINVCREEVVSVDMPSGINTDNGNGANVFVKAECTVTFCCKKPGHLLSEGREASGKVIVRNISMPEACILKQQPYIMTNDDSYPSVNIKERKMDSHKGDFGRIYIMAGSYLMSGAAGLCAKAALRAGSGLVTCVIPKSIIDRVGAVVPEATFVTYNEKNTSRLLSEAILDEICSSADAIAFGPGMGTWDNTVDLLKKVMSKFNGPLVIDADGINVLSQNKELLSMLGDNTILTPHPGELARLTGMSISEINADRLNVAKSTARELGCIILLKGASTVVTDGEKAYINTSGNPGMATGGAGDVLTGVIASLCGQGYSMWDAAVIGCYTHGRAGDEALSKHGYGLKAGDIEDCIGGLNL